MVEGLYGDLVQANRVMEWARLVQSGLATHDEEVNVAVKECKDTLYYVEDSLGALEGPASSLSS